FHFHSQTAQTEFYRPCNPLPQAPRRWLPVSCWWKTLEAAERQLPHVVLKLMAFREAAWKLANMCAYASQGQLSIAVFTELKALLKLADKA
ncbi:MAG: hypothetical protein MJA30_08230, partial [Cytophagales bacterium]|nr:hypothetical protein [Cytophagales bacterium]